MNDHDTDRLIKLAQTGDHTAQCQLLERHRDRLRRLVAAFLDPRVSARVDPSDVLQEAMASAALRLSDYLKSRPVDFYPWLRQIVKQQLVDVHRRHIRAQRRSVARENHPALVSDASAMQLAHRLISREPSPSHEANQREWLEKIKIAMSRMSDREQELLLMRFVEQLSVPEMARILAIPEASARSRVRRAIEKLSDLVKQQLSRNNDPEANATN